MNPIMELGGREQVILRVREHYNGQRHGDVGVANLIDNIPHSEFPVSEERARRYRRVGPKLVAVLSSLGLVTPASKPKEAAQPRREASGLLTSAAHALRIASLCARLGRKDTREYIERAKVDLARAEQVLLEGGGA